MHRRRHPVATASAVARVRVARVRGGCARHRSRASRVPRTESRGADRVRHCRAVRRGGCRGAAFPDRHRVVRGRGADDRALPREPVRRAADCVSPRPDVLAHRDGHYSLRTALCRVVGGGRRDRGYRCHVVPAGLPKRGGRRDRRRARAPLVRPPQFGRDRSRRVAPRCRGHGCERRTQRCVCRARVAGRGARGRAEAVRGVRCGRRGSDADQAHRGTCARPATVGAPRFRSSARPR